MSFEFAHPWVLGRLSPAFSRAGAQRASPLQDAHVSRQAMALSGAVGQLELRRLPSSSRARVGGRAVSLSLAVVPEPPADSSGLAGFDDEVAEELEALGYLEH